MRSAEAREDIVLKLPVYLDYHATTPVDDRVLREMLPYFSESFGNPSSRNHAFGWKADKAVERARRDVAHLVGASAKEVFFTSGATEANNLAIKGVMARTSPGRSHIVTLSTEHHAVLDTCQHMSASGCELTVLPVGADGLVDVDMLERVVTERTALVSVMGANNEIGVLQPLPAIAALAHAKGSLFHTDAAQLAGRLPLDIAQIGADLVSLTAHKLYGPKGVGALIVRRGTRQFQLSPQLHGGGQEHGLRPGTLNVPGIVGFGAAAALCRDELAHEPRRLEVLRDHLLMGLEERVGGLVVNGSKTARLPHNLNVSIAGVEGSDLHLALDDIAVSSGAACATTSAEPSHVLKALGVSAEAARATIRFGLGRFTTDEEVEYAVDKISKVIVQLRVRSSSLMAQDAGAGARSMR